MISGKMNKRKEEKKVVGRGKSRNKIKKGNRIGSKASLKSLKRYCKEVWSKFVKQRDGFKCVMCGRENYLNAHHIITAKCQHTRFETDCGISLCPKHHILGIVSAHGSPWIIYEWLKKNRPEQYKWFIENRDKVYDNSITPNLEFYKENLKKLLYKFEKHYPVIIERSKKFKFTELEEKNIVDDYINNEKNTISSMSKKYDSRESTISKILKRNNIKIRKNTYINVTPKRKSKLKDMKIKKYGKAIKQYDLSNVFIKEYPSIYEASRQTGIYNNTIRNQLHSLSKTAGGYIWKYKEMEVKR